MVSRRKILSRSRDDLHLEQPPYQPEDEEDVWYQKDKLFKVSEIASSFFLPTSPDSVIFVRHTHTPYSHRCSRFIGDNLGTQNRK